MFDKIAVVGLGKLGAPMVAVFASRNFKVSCYDINKDKCNDIRAGIASVEETGLQDLINQYRHNITVADSVSQLIQETEAVFIIVPTPSDENGIFSLAYVEEAVSNIGEAIKHKKDDYLVILTSTVMPQDCDKSIIPLLEKTSGKKIGHQLGFCYSPEFIALGSVIRDYLNPDFVLIGESDYDAGCKLENFYRTICQNSPPIKRIKIINAEIAKISINSFVTMKINFANMLARFCEDVDGGDVDEVTAAMGNDSRIGVKYLKGAVRYGGPCFPRDNRALTRFANRIEETALCPEATDFENKAWIDRFISKYFMAHSKKQSVAIMGLAYKCDTSETEESFGLNLAEKLIDNGCCVGYYDSQINETKCSIKKIEKLIDCLNYDIIVIAQPCGEYKKLNTALQEVDREITVVDCWRIIKKQDLPINIKLKQIGVN